jgi:acyl carrier protein
VTAKDGRSHNERAQVLDLDQFCALITESLETEGPQVTPEAAFARDLGVDSLGMLIVLGAIEDALGTDANLSVDLIASVETVRDAFTAYLEAMSSPPLTYRLSKGRL